MPDPLVPWHGVLFSVKQRKATPSIELLHPQGDGIRSATIA